MAANLSFKVPDEVLWELKANAVAARQKLGNYCLRILQEHGLNPEQASEKPKPISSLEVLKRTGIVKPASALPTRHKAKLVEVLEVDPESEAEEPDNEMFGVGEGVELEAQEPAAESAIPQKQRRTSCARCESPVKDWGGGKVRCTNPKCGQNSPEFL